MQDEILYLYGGDQPWDSVLWVTSDDRVRGGASQSHLTVVNPERVRFHGRLDTTALGGAGFASQHSLGELDWDLSDYQGIVVAVAGPTDGKRYTLTLKDALLPRRHDGRERSGLSWEAEFVPDGPGDVNLAWADFKPTYRGRPKPDAKPLDLKKIKRIGLMMRSFFDEQHGDFSLELHSIAAQRTTSSSAHDDASTVVGAEEDEEQGHGASSLKGAPVLEKREQRKPASRWRSLLCGL